MKKTYLLLLLLILSVNSFCQYSWTRYPDNPVFTKAPGAWDDGPIFPNTVLFYDDLYHLWYHMLKPDSPDRITLGVGYATSPDGINWTRYENNPIMTVGTKGEWDDRELADTHVIRLDTIFHMWYTASQANYGSQRIGHATSPDGIN